MSGTLVDRASSFLESRLSRRSVISRSAFAGSALATVGRAYVLTPGTAYEALCTCGNPDCGCGSTCCQGFSEFCCTINGGYNYCPTGTIIGGWWKADGSVYCDGPRYYLDCNAQCSCTDGCGDGYGFCDPGCDGLTCGCGQGSCDNWVTGCFQFRYGQCNQNYDCIGRILCRIVACVPPWEVDPSCTTTNAEDDGTADMNVPCNTAVPTPPPPPVPPPPPCDSPATNCQVSAMAPSNHGQGYLIVTSFGKVLPYGTALDYGDLSADTLVRPIVAATGPSSGDGYWLVASDGGVFAFGPVAYLGSMGGQPLNRPVVGAAARPGGDGYWLVASDGGVFCFGAAGFHGSMGGLALNAAVVAIAPTPSGAGYWLVASDGGVFCFGDAGFHGSMGGLTLNAPIVGLAASATGLGYVLVAADGGVFCFGDARFEGSEGGQPLVQPMVGIATSPDQPGYWLVAQDGGVFAYDLPFYGSPV